MSKESALTPGTIIRSKVREYRVLKVLGRGGFGITYLVKGKIRIENVNTEATFAVKEHFPAHLVAREPEEGEDVRCAEENINAYKQSIEDFTKEAERLKSFRSKNPNIVGVNEVFQANGTAYYVMENIEGVSLENYVRANSVKGRGLSEEESLRIFYPILDAVSFLHSERVNHLDIKPDNIMLRYGAEVEPVLIDFGQSVHFKRNGSKTSPKNTMGVSDGYAPLEQYAGIHSFAPEADVYALGATLYFMITGKVPPIAAEVTEDKLRDDLKHVKDIRIVDMICAAMRRDSTVRVNNVGALKSKLCMSGVQGGTVVLGGRDTGRRELDSGKWLKYALIALGIIVGLGLGVYLGYIISKKWGESPEREPDVVVTGDSVAEPLEKDTAKMQTTLPQKESAIAKESAKPSETKPNTLVASKKETGQERRKEPKPTEKGTGERNGVLELGYATWRGEVVNGRPGGKGVMTYHSAHSVGNTTHRAQPGDRFDGFMDGSSPNGKLYRTDGTIESVN